MIFFVLICLTPYGILSCRSAKVHRNNQLLGNVLSGAVLGSKNPPLRIQCYKLPDTDRSKPHDVFLERQYNGSYHAYIRDSLKARQNKTTFEVVTDLWPYDRWDIADNYLKMVSFESGTYFMTYKPSNDGLHRFSRIWKGYWDLSPTSDYDLLQCEALNKLASESPKVGDRLSVVGTLYNKKTKVYERIVQSVQADVLTTLPTRGAEQTEVVLSLTNSFSDNRLPINSPVYNQRDELVGYVKSHKPFGVLGVVIHSVHDSKLGALLKTLTQNDQWDPTKPQTRAPSQRFIDLVCSKITAK